MILLNEKSKLKLRHWVEEHKYMNSVTCEMVVDVTELKEELMRLEKEQLEDM